MDSPCKSILENSIKSLNVLPEQPSSKRPLKPLKQCPPISQGQSRPTRRFRSLSVLPAEGRHLTHALAHTGARVNRCTLGGDRGARYSRKDARRLARRCRPRAEGIELLTGPEGAASGTRGVYMCTYTSTEPGAQARQGERRDAVY